MFRSRHQTSQGAANLRGADKNSKERKNESTAYEEMYDFYSSSRSERGIEFLLIIKHGDFASVLPC
jgi:hypothetical protein